MGMPLSACYAAPSLKFIISFQNCSGVSELQLCPDELTSLIKVSASGTRKSIDKLRTELRLHSSARFFGGQGKVRHNRYFQAGCEILLFARGGRADDLVCDLICFFRCP